MRPPPAPAPPPRGRAPAYSLERPMGILLGGPLLHHRALGPDQFPARPVRSARLHSHVVADAHLASCCDNPHAFLRSNSVNDNRRQILEMLASGKITADEAERLIAALETGATQAGFSASGSNT